MCRFLIRLAESVTVGLFVIVGVDAVDAGPIVDHAAASIRSGDAYIGFGSGQFAAQATASNGSAYGTASVELLPGSNVLNMGAYASDNNFQNSITSGAFWYDTISIQGPIQPTTILLQFSVDADLLVPTGGAFKLATVYGGYNNLYSASIQNDGAGTISAQSYGTWQSATFIGSHFEGVALDRFFPDPVSSQLSTAFIQINLLASAYSDSPGDPAIADASHTLRLLAVTNLDGTPLTGDTITFASGMELPSASAVPEPSTLVMSSIMIGMFATTWAYKRLRATAARA